MSALAVRSLRGRTTAFAACALSIFLGSSVILAFLSLLDTAAGPGVSAADQSTLRTIALVVGGWGVMIVLFSVASTLGLSVRARAVEFALLRTIGAGRRQIRRLVVGETVLVAVVATLASVLPGWLLGRLVVHLLSHGDLVASTVRPRVGLLSIGVTMLALLLASAGAGLLAARAATRASATSALGGARIDVVRTSRARIGFGLLLMAVGATYSTLTVTVMNGSHDPYAAMSTAGPASVFWSLGLALLAAPLLRAVAVPAGPVLRLSRVSGYLAQSAVRRRPHQSGTALAPVIVFVGISTGTLYLMAVQNSVTATPDTDGRAVELLNYVVVALIAVFAAIMVVNTLVTVVSQRRREFAAQRLTGAGGRQLIAMVGYEAALILVTGIAFGALASLGTVIPFTVARTDGWWPGNGPGLFLAVSAAAVTLTLATALLAARRAVRAPVLAAIAAL